jgi:hypothetical protein
LIDQLYDAIVARLQPDCAKMLTANFHDLEGSSCSGACIKSQNRSQRGTIHQSSILARPTSSVFASGQRLQVQTIGPGDSGDEIGGGFAGGV